MFDLLDLLDVITADPSTFPEGFTTATTWTPSELDQGYEARGRRAIFETGDQLGVAYWSHCWHTFAGSPAPQGAHPIVVVHAYLGCRGHRGVDCQCVRPEQGFVWRSWCGQCERWSAIHTDEDAAVREMHDHCWPGWQALPVGPTSPRDEHWTQPGAPIITARKHGRRSVPGRSPFGGYDLAAEGDER